MPLSDFYPDMKGWTSVTPDISKAQSAPMVSVPPGPSQSPQSETPASPYLRTTLPLPLQYAPDTLKQYNRPGLSSFRIAPLPPGGAAAVNSAIGSTTTQNINEYVNTAAGGSNGAVQFNSGGALAGATQLEWNNGSSTLSIVGTVAVTGSISLAGILTASIFNATTGFQISGGATLANVLRGNGTDFVSAPLAAGDLSNGTTGTGAVVLATSPTISGTLTASGLIAAQANIQLGVAGTISGQITMEGSTSGSATITAPAAAGTITNPVVFSNSISSNGAVSGAEGLSAGVAGTTGGVITLEGATSGSCSITAPAVAGTPTNPIVFSNRIHVSNSALTTAQIDMYDPTSGISWGWQNYNGVMYSSLNGNGLSGIHFATNVTTLDVGVHLTYTIGQYNNITTAGMGVPPIYFSVKDAALTANYNAGVAKTLVTPTAASQYRISYSQAIVVVDPASSTFPSLTLGWTDVGGIARTKTLVSTSATNTTAVESDGDVTIYTNASTPVTITSAGYASGTAGTMTYALVVSLEQIS